MATPDELYAALLAAAREFVSDPAVPPFGPDEPHVWPDDRLREHAEEVRALLEDLGETDGETDK